MRKLELSDIILTLLWAIVAILMVFVYVYETSAQDNELYVCRDAEIVGRFEFRNVPQAWVDEGYWYLADGATIEGNTLIADALTEYPDDGNGITAGMVVLGNMDYSVEIRSDVQTPSCELENAPMPIVALNSPIVAAVQVVSTGTVCTVRYPDLNVVCG